MAESEYWNGISLCIFQTILAVYQLLLWSEIAAADHLVPVPEVPLVHGLICWPMWWPSCNCFGWLLIRLGSEVLTLISSMFSTFRLIKLISSLPTIVYACPPIQHRLVYIPSIFIYLCEPFFSCWINILPTLWCLWQTSLERISIQLDSLLFKSSWDI